MANPNIVEMNGHKITGPVYAIVTDNKDPEGHGRLKVKLNYLGKEIETDWVPMVIPLDKGFILPDIGDMVTIAFLDDNPNSGSVLEKARLNGEDEDLSIKNGKNTLSFIKGSNGYRVMFDASQEKEKIRIFTPDGEQYEVFSDGKTTRLNMNGDISREIVLSAKEKITFEGEDGDIEIAVGNPNEPIEVRLTRKNKDIDSDKDKKGDCGDIH